MDLSRKGIYGKIGSMRQLASVRRAVLDDGKGRGMRIIDINNGGNWSFTVYPDRGMDIGEASFKGVPLVWLTPGCGTADSYEPENFNWLRSWGGGLLTGCGLLNVGGPCEAGEAHGLHGRLSHLKAGDVNTFSGWENDVYKLQVSGKIYHSKVFGEVLLLTRTVSTALGSNSLVIEDEVENLGYSESPFMMLYHMNFSYPLVDKCAYFESPEHPVTPQNDHAAEGLDKWAEFSDPVPGFAEQIYYHDLPADADGMAEIKLVNPELKLALRVAYSRDTLPYLSEWKQMGQGEYALGIEPGNCLPEGQLNNAAKGVLKTILPGEKVRHKVVLTMEELV